MYALTKDAHTRFPREIRDTIYSFLLTSDDMQDLITCRRKHLDKFPYPHIDPTAADAKRGLNNTNTEPQFMISSLSYAPFATELADMRYEAYRFFWIDTPSHIPAFTNTAFFLHGPPTLRCTPLRATHQSLIRKRRAE
jgi:hypothetical protein